MENQENGNAFSETEEKVMTVVIVIGAILLLGTMFIYPVIEKTVWKSPYYEIIPLIQKSPELQEACILLCEGSRMSFSHINVYPGDIRGGNLNVVVAQNVVECMCSRDICYGEVCNTEMSSQYLTSITNTLNIIGCHTEQTFFFGLPTRFVQVVCNQHKEE